MFEVKAQLIAPTTEEEYNYGAVGYRIQLQTRMSDKPGYRIQFGGVCEEPGRKVTFNNMFRDKEQSPCATIMVYERPGSSPTYYCIPSANASPVLWDKFKSSLNGGTDKPVEQLHFFSSCLARWAVDDQRSNPNSK
jgi:hypothetical protein